MRLDAGFFAWPAMLGFAFLLAGTTPPRPAAEPSRSWRLVNGHHWQLDSEPLETAAETDAREGTRGECPAGMVYVNGQMKTDNGSNAIEELQKATCVLWIDRRYPERCARFDGEVWRRLSEHFPTRPMRFCIDRFEYPDEVGAYPVIDVSFTESAALCASRGLRLCSEDEWTFACEGDEATPYPTGYVRDPGACVIDRERIDVDDRALVPRESAAALAEIDRLWQGEASGARPGCRSIFGVYDLTGNVDEWTISVRPGERSSILKGGYWGRVRTRCRPSTRSHAEDYGYYQQGFRCCGDLP